MPMTPAQRQAEYRRRQRRADNGARRLDVWLPTAAALELRRIAAHRGLTQREVIIELIEAESSRVTEGMSDADYAAYLDGVTR